MGRHATRRSAVRQDAEGLDQHGAGARRGAPVGAPARGESKAVASAQQELTAAAAAFGASTQAVKIHLMFGSLVAGLAPRACEYLIPGIELVYEGYLTHYRESRTLSPAVDQATLLLAGDYLYAHGLQAIARNGDVEAVRLLTLLMACCSCLRMEGAPFALDDALWETAVRGVASPDGTPARTLAGRALSSAMAGISAGKVGSLGPQLSASLDAVRAACQREV